MSELASDALVVQQGALTTDGGTSLASPMWAAIWALVTQDYGRSHGGPHVPVPAGEAIYAAAMGSGPAAFDQTFDARTGWGVPDVAHLAEDIVAAYPATATP